jgi:hypothetical protein
LVNNAFAQNRIEGRASDHRDAGVARVRWEQRRLAEAASLLRDLNFVEAPGESPPTLFAKSLSVAIDVLPGKTSPTGVERIKEAWNRLEY